MTLESPGGPVVEGMVPPTGTKSFGVSLAREEKEKETAR